MEKDVRMELRLSGFMKDELPEGLKTVWVRGRSIRVLVSENRFQEFRMAAWAFHVDARDLDIERFEACSIKVTS